jgi:hypothetical protein
MAKIVLIAALAALFLVPTSQAATSAERTKAMKWYWTSGAECIKSKEGAWTSNTGNGYYGGFQADHSFQRAYGREFYYRLGTANNWKPWMQIVMAHRGWKARGFQPWPNTSRMCGLR